MSVRPAVTGKDAIRALRSLGFRIDRIEGSHHIMVKAGHPLSVPVPVHGNKVLPTGTLASIVRMAGLTKDQFFQAL